MRSLAEEIAGLRERIMRPRVVPAMFFDAQNAARLQGFIKGLERRRRAAAGDPIVETAEGHHEIGAPFRGDLMFVGGEFADLDFLVSGRGSRDIRHEPGVVLDDLL